MFAINYILRDIESLSSRLFFTENSQMVCHSSIGYLRTKSLLCFTQINTNPKHPIDNGIRPALLWYTLRFSNQHNIELENIWTWKTANGHAYERFHLFWKCEQQTIRSECCREHIYLHVSYLIPLKIVFKLRETRLSDCIRTHST